MSIGLGNGPVDQVFKECVGPVRVQLGPWPIPCQAHFECRSHVELFLSAHRLILIPCVIRRFGWPPNLPCRMDEGRFGDSIDGDVDSDGTSSPPEARDIGRLLGI